MCALVNHVDPWGEDIILDDVELKRLLDQPTAATAIPVDNIRLRANGFDNSMGDSWIYPNNLVERAYQLSIAKAALYHNTLVVLPTGLGKTFIAAVVMYNVYRWFPTCKVLFMAPTRPLVAQQIAACQRIMPFPVQDTVELTGKLQRARRGEVWQQKRVFFATPQVVQSDILGGVGERQTEFPFAQVRLVVVDEAHKAKGRYAYTEVVQAIWQRNPEFRVLALSATPGRTMEDVAEVVRNLLISHLEVRCETSIDVLPYIHKRHLRTIVVPLGDNIKQLREELLQIIDPYLRQLVEAGVLHTALHNINRNMLLYEQRRFRDHALKQRHPQQGTINSNFSICISLCHALELLERHGLRVFLNNFEDDEEGRPKFVLNMDRRLRDLVERLRDEMGPNPFNVSAHSMTNGKIAEMPKDLDFGHPKFEQARKYVLQHFENNPESRAIIFCEYRESVMLIYRLLLQHVPLLKPRCFVGQGGTSGSLRALSQKQQIQIMNDFRTGKSNILVATSIGEEGIDVGEVDLIVCFDISTSNPTRFVQRIGRTGRLKQGNVVMLVTEGKEQQLLKDALAQKDQTNKKLLQSIVVKRALYTQAPRLVPPEVSPQCIRTYVKPPNESITAKEESQNEQVVTISRKKSTAANKKKELPTKSDQDLRKFFHKSPFVSPLNAEESEIFEAITEPTQPAGATTQANLRKKVKTFFQPFEISEIDLTADSLAKASPLEIVDRKRLRKVDKFLQSNAALVSEQKRIYDFKEQLKCKQLSKTGKLMLLRSKPDFVRNLWQQMSIIEALQLEADYSMSPEEREIREEYEIVVSICGGSKAAVEKFLLAQSQENSQDGLTAPVTYPWDDLMDSDSDNDASFKNVLGKIFEGCEEQGVLAENFDFIQTELHKTQRYKKLMNTNSIEEPSYIYDASTEISDVLEQKDNSDYTITDSKYCSQWEDFAQRDLSNKSTPLQKAAATAVKSIQQQSQDTFLKSKTPLYNLIESHEPNENHTEETGKPNKKENGKNYTQEEEKSPLITTNQNIEEINSISSIQKELDFDLDVFLEPFSIGETASTSFGNGQSKENNDFNNINSVNAVGERQSPDIFEETLKITTKPSNQASKKPTFARKLAAQNAHVVLTSSPHKIWTTATIPTSESPAFLSPKRTGINTNSPKYKKSPSLFDMYLKGMRGRSGQIKSNFLASVDVRKSSTPLPQTEKPDESVIVRRSKAIKRRIIDSDSEEECKSEQCSMIGIKPLTEVALDDTDSDELSATQLSEPKKVRPRKKYRRNCSFLDLEAAASGSDSYDAEDHTEDTYQLDSMVISSEEEDPANKTAIQAMYLQSIKSPQRRHGNFKIPAHRIFNDRAEIYSQAVPVEPSQYLPDSFVVEGDGDGDEVDGTADKADATMCPLERAERILKERRRAKRQLARVATINRGRSKKT